jgi:mRNA-degrading endonuclease YafQ of YafQ-DinJ toxin-antitoxin module
MIEVDLNNSSFQKDLFALEKSDLTKVLSTFRKLIQMNWEQIYQDHGLNWEWIDDKDYYTLRASQKIRLAAKRDGNVLRFLGIFTDHDGAYN